MKSLSERELIEASREGRDAAFEELVNRHKMKAYSHAFFLVGNAEDALDISQEAFIRIYRNLHRFRGRSSFVTWLHRITFNLCMDHLRSRKRRHALPYDEHVHSPDGPVATVLPPASNPLERLVLKERRRFIRAAIERLPLKLRSVLVLREIEGLSYGEIAEVVGCSKGTVMSRLHYGRKKLRGILESEFHFTPEGTSP